jgi:GTP cyclohydrolase IA
MSEDPRIVAITAYQWNGYECVPKLPLDDATPEELIDAFLQKVCPDAYDPASPHMMDTPRRFTSMVREMTDGSEKWKFTTFESDSSELVVERGILFTSLCAHHIAPFSGVCHVGYIPEGKIAGLSKIARQVRSSSKMLTNQEELTSTIADTLNDILDPKGVAVVMKASHSCMTVRGALAYGTETLTSAMRGVFQTNLNDSKTEFLRLLNGGL